MCLLSFAKNIKWTVTLELKYINHSKETVWQKVHTYKYAIKMLNLITVLVSSSNF